MILPIVAFGSSVLREKCEEICTAITNVSTMDEFKVLFQDEYNEDGTLKNMYLGDSPVGNYAIDPKWIKNGKYISQQSEPR